MLAMQIVRGEHRNKGRWGGQYGERILEEATAVFDTVVMPAKTASTPVVIAWKFPPEKVVEHATAAVADLSIILARDEGVSEAQIRERVGHKDSNMVKLSRHLRTEDSRRHMERMDFGTGLSERKDSVDPNQKSPDAA